MFSIGERPFSIMSWDETTSANLLASTSSSYPYQTSPLMGNFMEDDNITDFDPCKVPDSPDRRWYLVAVAGTTLSVISFFCNLLIARLLLRPKYSHFFFLGLLAVSDAFLSFCYGPVIAMDVIKNRLRVCFSI